MFKPDEKGVYARISASPARRGFAYAMLLALGLLLLLIVFRTPPSLPLAFTMGAMGMVSIVLGERLRRATSLSLELTADDLRDSSGRILVKVADIKAVERGSFAFKPSNGFLLVTSTRSARAWAPGLWWRVGRRVGVGGVLPSGQAKFMAEVISHLISQRGQ